MTDKDNNGGQLLDDIEIYLARYVAHPEDWALAAHTLWIAHTWFIEKWDSTPRLAFLSVEPGSGKSRALEVTEPLVPRAVHALNASPAAVFRRISSSDGRPTLLFDEVDTVFGPRAKGNEDLRGLLNAGHRQGATVLRMEVDSGNKGLITRDFESYCAVALAGLDSLPDTITSRSVVIQMRRRAPGQIVEPWRRRVTAPVTATLSARLATWSAGSVDELQTWPEMPHGIEDRDADVWEALLAVADLAGGRWPRRARDAAVAAVAYSAGTVRPTVGVELLRDIREVFHLAGDPDRMTSADLVEGLCGLEEAQWGNHRGASLTPRRLAALLKQYDIKPTTIRVGDQTPKGYMVSDDKENTETLAMAWARYLDGASSEHNIRNNEHDATVTAPTAEQRFSDDRA